MDVNLINPILTAVVNVLPMIGFSKVERQGLAIIREEMINQGVIVNISVVGDLKGAILIGMDLDTARQVASKMMMGMPVAEFNELAQSAVGELGNMVCANAVTILSNSGYQNMDISPPAIIQGVGGRVKLLTPQVVRVSFLADGLKLDICVGVV
ncbi:MAG: chemotaxis protein CheX [Negativicutes bacterium]|nr:chemotaxis protein CheX [Negativicutes bacterium]